MIVLTRMASVLGICATLVAAAAAQEPRAKPIAEKAPEKAKVEFRWLEHNFVKDVTEEKGIRTTCREELSYPHKKAVLSNQDVAKARLSNSGNVMGLNGDHYLVSFRFTDDALKTLAKECGDAAMKEVAIFVDGKYWGTAPFHKAKPEDFHPSAGFFTSKADAERVIASCPDAKAAK